MGIEDKLNEWDRKLDEWEDRIVGQPERALDAYDRTLEQNFNRVLGITSQRTPNAQQTDGRTAVVKSGDTPLTFANRNKVPGKTKWERLDNLVLANPDVFRNYDFD